MIGNGYNIRGKKIIYKLNNNINGKGKEYNKEGDLLFEGEYINCKRNGKGKDYYLGKSLKFEGEYLNDLELDGKGYDSSGNIKYELKSGKNTKNEYYEYEYSNGDRKGRGKEYNNEGKLIYEGE